MNNDSQLRHGVNNHSGLKSLCLDLKKAVFSRLLSVGFKSNKNKFYYKEINDVTCVIDLQKSSYSFRYYINIGIWYNIYSPYTLEPVSKCHSTFRAEAIPCIEEQKASLRELLDLESYPDFNDSFSEDRFMELKNFIDGVLLPCINTFSVEYFFSKFKENERWFSTSPVIHKNILSYSKKTI